MKILKINKHSCNEEWEKMEDFKNGKFCLSCEKNVLNFENLSDCEIVNLIDSSKGKVCVRVPYDRVEKPLNNNQSPFNYLKKGVFLTKVIITASILVSNEIHAQYKKQEKLVEINHVIKDSIVELKGQFLREKDNTPVINAEIQLITLNKIFRSFTDKNGEYTLGIPYKLLNEENVFRISYNNVTRISDESDGEPIPPPPPPPESLKTNDFIIHKNEMNKPNKVLAEDRMLYLGTSSWVIIGKKGVIPIVYFKGKEISYEEYEKNKKKGIYKSNNYFGSRMAKIISGKNAENGLILLF